MSTDPKPLTIEELDAICKDLENTKVNYFLNFIHFIKETKDDLYDSDYTWHQKVNYITTNIQLLLLPYPIFRFINDFGNNLLFTKQRFVNLWKYKVFLPDSAGYDHCCQECLIMLDNARVTEIIINKTK